MISKSSKIYVAGHKGMVGSATVRKLQKEGFNTLIFKTSKELDLRNQSLVDQFIAEEKPQLIIDAAAMVGGIWANNEFPYKFLMDNMLIQNNLINAAVKNKVKNFIFLGSSCIYPRDAKQPLKEEYLLTSSLESTNQWYALAKITGVKLLEAARKVYGYNYVSLMPTNLYGPNDNFDPMTSHVLPGMITKFHNSKIKNENTVNLWGDGTPLREFLHVDDLANAIYFCINNNLQENLYNVGSEDEVSIKQLAEIVKDVIGYQGKIVWDLTYPNGTPRKKLDSSKFRSLGWKPKVKLYEGITKTYHLYLSKINE
jgi:GDP-L-fucose synthase